MHMIIRAIVFAKNNDDALNKAEIVFKRLCEDQRPFDYYAMFDTPGTAVSGAGRWGQMEAVSLASSRQGLKLINEGMKYQKESFLQGISRLKQHLKRGIDELWLNNTAWKKDIGSFHYTCHQLGQYSGGEVFLYDQDGEGIRSETHLDDVLNRWADKEGVIPEEYSDLKVYVVPADVHM